MIGQYSIQSLESHNNEQLTIAISQLPINNRHDAPWTAARLVCIEEF